VDTNCLFRNDPFIEALSPLNRPAGHWPATATPVATFLLECRRAPYRVFSFSAGRRTSAPGPRLPIDRRMDSSGGR